MVRTRLRAFVLPLAFYSFSALVAGYFVWHALNGQRGLKTRDEYTQKVAEMQTSLESLRKERAAWQRKINLVRGEEIDRDVLDEQSRIELGRLHKNEVVILLPEQVRITR